MLDNKITLPEIAAMLENQSPARHSLALSFGDFSVDFRTNSEGLVEELRRYYLEFVVDSVAANSVVYAYEREPFEFDLDFVVNLPEPGKTKVKEEYYDLDGGRIVRKILTGMQFLFGGDVHLAVGPTLANPNQVINFINNRMIQWALDKGALLFHAAGVHLNGTGLVFAGFSGAGKSSLALHLMHHGTTFVSNDRLMVWRENGNLVMAGVPKLPRINPGTILSIPELAENITSKSIESYKDLPLDDLWKLEEKYDAFIDEIYGENKFLLKSPMNGLILLTWKHNPGEVKITKVDLRQRPDLLPAFMKTPGLFYLPNEIGAERTNNRDYYVDLMKDCAIYEFSGSVDFNFAANYCLKLLNG